MVLTAIKQREVNLRDTYNSSGSCSSIMLTTILNGGDIAERRCIHQLQLRSETVEKIHYSSV